MINRQKSNQDGLVTKTSTSLYTFVKCGVTKYNCSVEVYLKEDAAKTAMGKQYEKDCSTISTQCKSD